MPSPVMQTLSPSTSSIPVCWKVHLEWYLQTQELKTMSIGCYTVFLLQDLKIFNKQIQIHDLVFFNLYRYFIIMSLITANPFQMTSTIWFSLNHWTNDRDTLMGLTIITDSTAHIGKMYSQTE